MDQCTHKHSTTISRNMGLSNRKETQSGKDLHRGTNCLMNKVLCSYFAQRSGEKDEGRSRKSNVEEAFQGLSIGQL